MSWELTTREHALAAQDERLAPVTSRTEVAVALLLVCASWMFVSGLGFFFELADSVRQLGRDL